jgi:hypothetical protein
MIANKSDTFLVILKTINNLYASIDFGNMANAIYFPFG